MLFWRTLWKVSLSKIKTVISKKSKVINTKIFKEAVVLNQTKDVKY